MRTSGHHELTFHELDQPEMMIIWGTSKRRKRFKPTALLVKWYRKIGEPQYRLVHVFLMGSYVHAATSTGLSTTLYEHGAWSDETPRWAKELVESCLDPGRLEVTK